MAKSFKVTLTFNKNNGQMNFALPKKKMSKKFLSDISKSKKMKIKIEELYPDGS